MTARRSLLDMLTIGACLGACLVALPGAMAAQAATGGAKKPAGVKKPVGATSATTTQAARPTARQVIDAYVKAIGGREALLARTSMKRAVTLEVPAQGLKADIELSTMAPNKFYVRQSMPGMGESTQGFDGTTAWAIDPMQGPRVLTGAELDQAKAQADIRAELRESANYASLDVVADTTFEGRPAWKVRLVRKSGEELREYYDKENGLLLGAQSIMQSPIGPLEATSLNQDWKPVHGILTPTRSVRRVNGQELVLTLVSSDTTVDPSVFELPAQIKALVPAPAK